MDTVAEIETQSTNPEMAREPKNTVFFTRITLPFPFTYEGKTYKTLTFDWKKLTGKDFAEVEFEMKMTDKILVAEAFDGDFISLLAVRACREKISREALLALLLYYYQRVRSAGKDFLRLRESEAVEAYGSLNNA